MNDVPHDLPAGRTDDLTRSGEKWLLASIRARRQSRRPSIPSTCAKAQRPSRIASRYRWEGELLHTKKDGTQATVASRWSVRRDARGRPIATLETNNDITERRLAEQALRRSDAYLTEAQRLSLTGSFGWNVPSGELFWSEETFRVFGYDRTTKPSPELCLQRVHPADIARVRQLIDDASRDGKDWEIEHPLLMPDGSVKSVHVVAHAVNNESGGVEFVGAIMDVSAAKRAEQDLRQAQAELPHIARVTALGELTASIAHEVNQPITGVVTNAAAALRWLSTEPPDISRACEILDQRRHACRRHHLPDPRPRQESAHTYGVGRRQ